MPKAATPSSRRTGDQTRALILAAATTEFREHGYDGATLDDVARHLGVTRSAVLHHYTSKADILQEIVRPMTMAWDAMLAEAEAAPARTDRDVRRLLSTMVDVVFEHRDVTAILSRDVTASHALDPASLPGPRLERLVALLAPDGAPDARVRAFAVMGAIARPASAPAAIADTVEVRKIVADSAYAALRS